MVSRLKRFLARLVLCCAGTDLTHLQVKLSARSAAYSHRGKLHWQPLLIVGGRTSIKAHPNIASRAQQIVDSKGPYGLAFDGGEKHSREDLFGVSEWVKANSASEANALYEQLSVCPVEFSLLAMTGDPRGLPILRKGLPSANYGIQMYSAEGLALLQDKASIPRITDAARNAPGK